MRRSRLARARELQAAVAALERSHGPDDPHTLRTRIALAEACREAYEYEDPYQQEWDDAGTAELAAAVAGLARTLGPEHPETLVHRRTLAVWRSAPFDDASAAELARIAEAQERVAGPAHPDTLETWDHVLFRARGPGRAALQERIRRGWRQVIADRARDLGPDAPQTSAARRRLAALCRDAGRDEEARTLRAEVVAASARVAAGRVRSLGPAHPDAVAARMAHARHVRWHGDADGAVRLLRQIAADQHRLRGPDDPGTLNTLIEVVSWTYRPDARDAGLLLERAYPVPGVTRAALAGLRYALLCAYVEAGREDDALALFARYPLAGDDDHLDEAEPPTPPVSGAGPAGR
ncbi:hypothetical protein [Dactylosporangium sp. NPDC049140]|uniref:hypothetical protein n=1 Tax=Dactylosporangium sp. NPDC049140 TaxID=3155647 RepID=UPI0033E04CC1